MVSGEKALSLLSFSWRKQFCDPQEAGNRQQLRVTPDRTVAQRWEGTQSGYTKGLYSRAMWVTLGYGFTFYQPGAPQDIQAPAGPSLPFPL